MLTKDSVVFNKTVFALKLSRLDFGPKASFDPAELTGGVQSEWGLGGEARQEGELTPGG